MGQANGESAPAGATATVLRPGELVLPLFFFTDQSITGLTKFNEISDKVRQILC